MGDMSESTLLEVTVELMEEEAPRAVRKRDLLWQSAFVVAGAMFTFWCMLAPGLPALRFSCL